MKVGRDIAVGMGECAVASGNGDRLTMILGSCVGVMLIDEEAHVASALHAMLPRAQGKDGERGRYVDTGLPIAVGLALKAGARRSRLKAKLAGGANMFPKLARTFVANIGERNVEAARGALAEAGIELTAEDVGGTVGRVASLDPDRGTVEIRAGNSRRVI
ncbi:MAG TPA: chemotaxis protein CheD [bacterium]|nr:chemotaxis protein CheD [bacterium]